MIIESLCWRDYTNGCSELFIMADSIKLYRKKLFRKIEVNNIVEALN